MAKSSDICCLDFYSAPDVRQSLTIAIMLTGLSSFFISYGSAWCVRCTSSTTYSMIGSLNKLPVAASGILFMGDPATMGNVLGIFLGFIAGILYSYSKSDQAQKNLALANTSSLSKPLMTEFDNVSESVPAVTAPAGLSSTKSGLPLYKSNPDGKVAD